MYIINIIDLMSLIMEDSYYLRISTLTYFIVSYGKKFDINTEFVFPPLTK